MTHSFWLNIFYSGIKYTEEDWVRLKVRHYLYFSIKKLPRTNEDREAKWSLVLDKVSATVSNFGMLELDDNTTQQSHASDHR